MSSVSVLLPFHESSETIHDAIKSIYDQTFQDWELILINNNADQTTLSIANEWVNNDVRIKLINETEQGISFALNAGLQVSNSKYIARMDSDDISFSERFQKQFSLLESAPNVDVVSCMMISNQRWSSLKDLKSLQTGKIQSSQMKNII